MYGKETETLDEDSGVSPHWRSNNDFAALEEGGHGLSWGEVKVPIRIDHVTLTIDTPHVKGNKDLVLVPPLSHGDDMQTLTDLAREQHGKPLTVKNDSLVNNERVVIISRDPFRIPFNQPLDRLVLMWRRP